MRWLKDKRIKDLTVIARTLPSFVQGESLPAIRRETETVRRIIACVNACDGIPTESLGAGIVKRLNVTVHDAFQALKESDPDLAFYVLGNAPDLLQAWNIPKLTPAQGGQLNVVAAVAAAAAVAAVVWVAMSVAAWAAWAQVWAQERGRNRKSDASKNVCESPHENP